MYYPIPVYKDQSNPIKDWGVGIAESRDLYNWKKIGGVTPDGEHEKKGLATTCSVIIINKVDLFYQTYGNGTRDAICHAVAIDEIHL